MEIRFAGIFPGGSAGKQFVRDDLRRTMAEFGRYTEHEFERGADHDAELTALLGLFRWHNTIFSASTAWA